MSTIRLIALTNSAHMTRLSRHQFNHMLETMLTGEYLADFLVGSFTRGGELVRRSRVLPVKLPGHYAARWRISSRSATPELSSLKSNIWVDFASSRSTSSNWQTFLWDIIRQRVHERLFNTGEGRDKAKKANLERVPSPSVLRARISARLIQARGIY
ncbi:hypothetical protein BDV96DRAFT_117800 [Lophiotrema nucula]|uniref:Uncharacterized protein n=1 Tax=Lophiotrema nucula TaxID=690887 RepID=A0A6A5Z4I9_9PLEO|nr:hypothetical protein BDV96DRAFT_117800 [Lophiotrema nucula]